MSLGLHHRQVDEFGCQVLEMQMECLGTLGPGKYKQNCQNNGRYLQNQMKFKMTTPTEHTETRHPEN